MTDKQTTPNGLCMGCGKVHDNPVTEDMAAGLLGAMLGAQKRDRFSGLEAALGKLFGDKPAKEAHPAGAVARMVRSPSVGLGLEWLGEDRPEEGTYVFPGAPTVATDAQATAAVQAMRNLGYAWTPDQHWFKNANRAHADAAVAQQEAQRDQVQGTATSHPMSLDPKSPENSSEHAVAALKKGWRIDGDWQRVATAVGLTPDDHSAEAVLCYRVFLALDGGQF